MLGNSVAVTGPFVLEKALFSGHLAMLSSRTLASDCQEMLESDFYTSKLKLLLSRFSF